MSSRSERFSTYRRSILATFLIAALCSCGGGSGTNGSSTDNNAGTGGNGTTPQQIPALTAIAPSSTIAGGAAVTMTLYGSNFQNSAVAQWNGTALSSSYVSATELMATVPASDIVSVGTAQITVNNLGSGGGISSPENFTIVTPPPPKTVVRTVTGIAAPQDIAWDGAHGELYVSVASTDPTIPNTVIPINPLTGTTGTPVPAGNKPDLLSISSDASYLWVGLDGSDAVQRFLLPGLTKDISFSLPLDSSGNPQQAVNLQAATVSPHTVAVIAGHWDYSPVGDGVYVYDDAIQRPTFVPGWGTVRFQT